MSKYKFKEVELYERSFIPAEQKYPSIKQLDRLRASVGSALLLYCKKEFGERGYCKRFKLKMINNTNEKGISILRIL